MCLSLFLSLHLHVYCCPSVCRLGHQHPLTGSQDITQKYHPTKPCSVFFDERKSSEELSRLEVELRQALERREEALDRAREELSQMEGFQDPAME